MAKARLTRTTGWVRWRDAQRAHQASLMNELSELAIEFAALPERQWRGDEIAVILRKRIAKRRKIGPVHNLPGDELPSNAVKMQMM